MPTEMINELLASDLIFGVDGIAAELGIPVRRLLPDRHRKESGPAPGRKTITASRRAGLLRRRPRHVPV
jgi:hypothetical protein